MQTIKRYYFWFTAGLLLTASVLIWQAVYNELPNQTLTVAVMNVGQGDSIYIESPTHVRMIIDGGPDGRTLSEISKLVPWYTRSLDFIMVTNPDVDHYAGFMDVIKHYHVNNLFEAGTKAGSPVYTELQKDLQAGGAKVYLAKRGMVIDLGGGAHFDILFPAITDDVTNLKTNDGSIIGRLVYGSTSIMFTGDAPKALEEHVVALDGSRLQSTILKVAHHGSKYSDSESFYTVVRPQYALISAGIKNRYGHPHQEILDLLKKFNIPTFITAEEGTIIFQSDGKTFVRR